MSLSSNKKNKLYLILMAASFLLPLIIAHYMYFYGDIKGATTNKGILLSNPHNVSELQLNKPVIQSADAWRDARWHILYLPPQKCDKKCEQILYKLQQVHIAMGKNKDRIQRVIIHNNNISSHIDEWRYIYQKYPHMTMTSFNNISPLNTEIIKPDNIYIADPIGNIVMRYDLNGNGLDNFDDKIHKDAKKLLSISRIG